MMKRFYVFLSLAALSVTASVAQNHTTTTATNTGGIAIIHAKAYIIPGEAPVKDATILIERGKIQEAGARLKLPAGARIVDAKGAIVTPGLMNSDSQLGLTEILSQETTDSAVTSGPFGAGFDVEYGLNPNSTLLPVARADGLTRAMVMPTGSATPPFNGLGAVLCLSEGPDILDRSRAAVVAQVGGMVSPKSGGSRSAQWMLIRAALDGARRNPSDATAKDPSAKEMPGNVLLSPINVSALLPVLQGKIPLVVLASRESDLRQAVALEDDYNIHIVLVGAESGWRIAGLLASHHIPVVLNPYANIPATFDQLGARLDNAAILDRAGVTISFKAAFVHVSHNAGLAIREGAGIAVANGMPWGDALKALTVNPAITWGIADHYGTLQPGKDADVVLWDGDPLEPSSAPKMVFIRGNQISLETRQTNLERRYSPRNMRSPIPPAFR